MASTSKKSKGSSFKQTLTKDQLDYFNNVAKKPFSEQAVEFLNAYWVEVGKDNADFIFNVSWELLKATEMHFQGISLRHLYVEGINLDFDAGLYLFEKLNNYVDDKKNEYADEKYEASHPKEMTAIVRKKELKKKVDVNFDGRVSFIEFLLYQYEPLGCKPENFCERGMAIGDEPPEVRKARLALADVQKAINAYEKERARLEKLAGGKGVKALGAKNQLAQLDSSPLKAELRQKLITASAAVRIAIKRYGGTRTPMTGQDSSFSDNRSAGSCYWLKSDLKAKKSRYGKKKR
jgi:hypothetical protein